MRSKSPQGALADILRNIELARGFVADMSFEAFRSDQRTFYAVIRCLEIISEASRKLPDDLKARHANIPWAEMAAAGNFYRHDYDGVLEHLVWRTVERSLEPLRAAVAQELSKLQNPK
jgi:uncharacterized protein with HEPN domain